MLERKHAINFCSQINQKMEKNNIQPKEQPNNPLHGVKLITILEVLEERYGWEWLAMKININCFKSNPSIKSSLTFLRKTRWARDKVEQLYLDLEKKKKMEQNRNREL